MNSTMLHLDTKHALDPTNPADATWEIQLPYGSTITQWNLSLASVILPNVSRPITSVNNVLYISENDGPVVPVPVPEGYYTATSLAVELENQLNALLVESYTVSYLEASKQYLIQVPLPNTFAIEKGNNSIAYTLGYLLVTGQASSHVSIHAADLSGSLYVDVVSNLSVTSYASDGRTNILARIPLIAQPGELLLYEDSTEDFLDVRSHDLQTLNLQLRDDLNRPMQFSPGASVAYSFKLTPAPYLAQIQ